MKKLLAILALLALIAGLFFLLRTKNPPATEPAVPNETVSSAASNSPAVLGKTQNAPSVATAPGISAPIAPDQTDLAWRAASPNPTSVASANTNQPPDLPPLTVLDKARVSIHNYHAAFGENPVGTNPEIT